MHCLDRAMNARDRDAVAICAHRGAATAPTTPSSSPIGSPAPPSCRAKTQSTHPPAGPSA